MSQDLDYAARLRGEGLDAYEWSNGPGDTYAAHSHGYDKVIVATSGSIVFHLIDTSRDVSLAVGERLELPAGTIHGAIVGPSGVQCLEAHLPAGSLGADPRHLERGW